MQDHDVRIVVPDSNPKTAQIVESLQKRIPGAKVVEDLARRPSRKRIIYITVGPAALRQLVANDVDGNVVSIFASSQAYRTILDGVPRSTASVTTAIFAEPSPADQLHLISLLYKKRPKVSVLLTANTDYLVPLLQRAAAARALPLDLVQMSQGESVARSLLSLDDAPVLLAVPDSAIYNADSLRSILTTTYRQGKSVVGFSAAMVKAGALATTYSDIDDITAQTAEMLAELARTDQLPEPQFPKYFDVVINEDVARSLNLIIDAPARAFSRKPGRK